MTARSASGRPAMTILLPPLLVALSAWADPSQAEEIARLIRQLGSERFEEREAATRRLDALGEAALPALRRAAGGDEDIEIRRRAAALVRPIERRLAGERLVLVGPPGEVRSVALSANGKIGLSACGAGPVRIWDLEAGKELRRLADVVGPACVA